MNLDSRIFIAGHNGMVGSNIKKILEESNYTNILTVEKSLVDLTDSTSVNSWFEHNLPEYVFLCAAKVGGIVANATYPIDFINNNLEIQTNIIKACHKYNVKKLLFLGSVCIYPKFAPVPVKEEYLLTGSLEETNQWYAIAKIAGIKQCLAYNKQYGKNFISAMPCNLYGPNDNYHPTNSHVIPGLIRKFHEAKLLDSPSVICWGDGTPRREFLNVIDAAEAFVYLMNHYDCSDIINVGYGEDYTISEIVDMIKDIVQYKGKIIWDSSRPNGTPKRLLDSTKIFNLGWRPKIKIHDGLKKAYRDFQELYDNYNLYKL